MGASTILLSQRHLPSPTEWSDVSPESSEWDSPLPDVTCPGPSISPRPRLLFGDDLDGALKSMEQSAKFVKKMSDFKDFRKRQGRFLKKIRFLQLDLDLVV